MFGEFLSTTIGELALEEVELAIGDRTWSILHAGALISAQEEVDYIVGEHQAPRPYGVALWPAAIALAHDLASRAVEGKTILELGAGTGLPGIVAASLGARVLQTDRQSVALHLCARNAANNPVRSGTLEQRAGDWTAWSEDARFDLIVGSDILYAKGLHDALRAIFERNLAPGGTVVLADPMRPASIGFLEALEAAGWRISLDKWTLGDPPRPVGVYTLTR